MRNGDEASPGNTSRGKKGMEPPSSREWVTGGGSSPLPTPPPREDSPSDWMMGVEVNSQGKWVPGT